MPVNTDVVKLHSPSSLSALRKVFSLLRKWEKWTALVLVVAVVSSLYWNWQIFYIAHTALVPTNGGTLVEGLVGQPHFINPILATTSTDQTIMRAVFSGLYRYNTSGELEPDLAVAMPEISADGKHYTVRIQPNTTWHDGQAITADDILFTISEIQNEITGSPLRGLWLSTTVQKLDALTVVFVTKDVSAPFLHNLTLPLLPQHIWQSVGPENVTTSQFNLKPLGSGPFAIRQIEKDPDGNIQRLFLQSFRSHARKPKLDGITLVFYNSLTDLEQGYINREVSSLGLSINDNIALEPTATAKQTALPQYQALFLNTTSPHLRDPRVRQALRLATDSHAISTAAWNSRVRPLTGIPLGLASQESALTSLNNTEAEKILDAAGWKRNNSGIRTKKTNNLILTLVTADTPSFQLAAELVAKEWKTIGVQVEVKALPAANLIEEHVRPRQYDVLLFSQRTGADFDPFAFWHSSQTKDPGLNVSNFSSSELDKLITDSRTTTNPKARETLYQKLTELLESQTPAIYLNQSLYTYVLDKNLTSAPILALPDPSWRLSFASDWYFRTARSGR